MVLTPTLLYEILSRKINNPNWWPVDKKYHDENKSDPRFEVIIGAILTQNTNWSNVEKTLRNLKLYKKLDIKIIEKTDIKRLTELIKSSGFFNQKANRIKNISQILKYKYNSNLDNFFNRDIDNLRKELLSIKGIGPETADSIILYAGDKPIFVVDAYTKRICKRLPFKTNLSYEDVQLFFQNDLSKSYQNNILAKIYSQLHAQIVILAKEYCKKKPSCINCPLKKYCKYYEKLFE